MIARPHNVLFLCTGNSARSIIAEALLRHFGKGGFNAFSAGSAPRGLVHPMALQVLQREDVPTGGLASKSWETYAAPQAPTMHFVITVCNRAAGEVCPIWPGKPVTATWETPDPAAVTGDERKQLEAFRQTLRLLERRIQMLVSFNYTESSREQIERDLAYIGLYFISPPTDTGNVN